ncbi:MAG: Nif3-like dinuclear metal center hexameric protein [Bacteroidota bacterium]
MTRIKDLIQELESVAPRAYQESYDNSGLLVGNPNTAVKGVLITLDVTEEVVNEAVDTSCNVIIAHHPIIFNGLKSLTGKNYVERTVISAVKNDIAIYAIHTNLDNVHAGVNKKICDKLGLINTQILKPKNQILSKLVTFIPVNSTKTVLAALHKAGAGQLGNYENCSFTLEGTGSFTSNKHADPSIGSKGVSEKVTENRVEVIFPNYKAKEIIKTLNQAHPYEEVAYYLHNLENENQEVGSGMIGELKNEINSTDFLHYLKEKMELNCIRHTKICHDKIRRVAVCGGSGSFLLRAAKAKNADIFVTSDFKYHEFFDAENSIIIADIGHYESEVFTKELLHEILREKFDKFALNLSNVETNPIRYI